MNLVVVHLLPLASTHEGRLGALVVDISPEVFLQRFRRLLRLFNGLIDLSLSVLIEFLCEGKRIEISLKALM